MDLYIPPRWVGELVSAHTEEHIHAPGYITAGRQHGLAARRRSLHGEGSLGSVWEYPMGEEALRSSGN